MPSRGVRVLIFLGHFVTSIAPEAVNPNSCPVDFLPQGADVVKTPMHRKRQRGRHGGARGSEAIEIALSGELNAAPPSPHRQGGLRPAREGELEASRCPWLGAAARGFAAE